MICINFFGFIKKKVGIFIRGVSPDIFVERILPTRELGALALISLPAAGR